MRRLLMLCAVAVSRADPTPAEKLIEAGHWKRARTIVEAVPDLERLHSARPVESSLARPN